MFSRPTVLAFRDKSVTPAQIGQQLGARYALTGTIRRAGQRLRISAQLVDTRTDFPLWSERYDRELQDIFELQDEIAHKIADALRVTLSPQEQAELAAKPTESLQAYDLYLRGKSYARRLTRQDLEFALQMFEHAVAIDPKFALVYAAMANTCAQHHYNYGREGEWIDRAKAAAEKAAALQPLLPEAYVARAWVAYASGQQEDAIWMVRQAIDRKRDCEGAYYLLGRALFQAGRHQEVADITDAALEASGEDYNVYVPIMNSLESWETPRACWPCGRGGSRPSSGNQERSRGRPSPHSAGDQLRTRRSRRRCDARGEAGGGAEAERGNGAVQRRLCLLHDETVPRGHRRAPESVGGRIPRSPVGPARSGSSWGCTATRNSSECIHKGTRNTDAGAERRW